MSRTAEAPVKSEQAEITRQPAAASARFQADVERQFEAELGRGRQFTDFEKRLTQHMFLKVDQALKAAEERRKQGKEFNWNTIDRQKLALDTVHRVSLGLDALIPNHIWPVTYWNTKKNAYDVDLRIGYVGQDYVARAHAMEPPLQILYELVHSSDTFKALPRSGSREVEGYEFEINSPFDRGAIVGGFGYLVYDDPRKNRLILVTERDFARSKKASKSSFWADNDVEMHLKTVYHRVASRIPLDPQKVNATAAAALFEEDRGPVQAAFQDIDAVTADDAHQTIDVEPAQPQPAPAAVQQAPAGDNGSLFDEAPPF